MSAVHKCDNCDQLIDPRAWLLRLTQDPQDNPVLALTSGLMVTAPFADVPYEVEFCGVQCLTDWLVFQRGMTPSRTLCGDFPAPCNHDDTVRHRGR